MDNKIEGVGTQSHYENQGIQPIDYIVANKMNFLEGNVIKYVTRYKQKNGLEDLKKAQQYLTWLIDEVILDGIVDSNQKPGQLKPCKEGETLRECIDRVKTADIKNATGQHVTGNVKPIINPHLAGIENS